MLSPLPFAEVYVSIPRFLSVPEDAFRAFESAAASKVCMATNDGRCASRRLHGHLLTASGNPPMLPCRGHLAGYDTAWKVLTESLLTEVFVHPVAVIRHPLRDYPWDAAGGRHHVR